MAGFTNIVDGFNQCEPPFCPNEISIDITLFKCTDGVIYVNWTINDIYDRNLTPTSNKVFYSLNNSEPKINGNSINAFTSTNPYSVYFEKPTGEGLIYIEIEVTINSEFIRAVPPGPLSTDECTQDSVYAVRARICQEYIDEFGAVNQDLWVKKNGIPSLLPVYIKYDGTVSSCCADTINVLIIGKIGNDEPLKNILSGDKIRDIKRIHLSGNLDDIPLCKYCTNRTVVDLSQEKNELLKFI